MNRYRVLAMAFIASVISAPLCAGTFAPTVWKVENYSGNDAFIGSSEKRIIAWIFGEENFKHIPANKTTVKLKGGLVIPDVGDRVDSPPFSVFVHTHGTDGKRTWRLNYGMTTRTGGWVPAAYTYVKDPTGSSKAAPIDGSGSKGPGEKVLVINRNGSITLNNR